MAHQSRFSDIPIPAVIFELEGIPGVGEDE
jgi:hypothetical protein